MIEIIESLSDQEQRQDSEYRSFEEYQRDAEIPNLTGVSGKVLEVLQKRIGSQPVNIDDVAKEMSLSKRTLQRRLKDEEVNFAELRDKVRYNQAIECLLVRNMSVEAIATYLDFSDRTSFTNAFKRWTKALAPSPFRRTYRDYV